MKKVLIIPHHPANDKIKVRLVEVAKALAHKDIVYLVRWQTSWGKYSLFRRVASTLGDALRPKKKYKEGNLRIIEFPVFHRPLALAVGQNSFWLERVIQEENIDIVINGSYYLFQAPKKAKGFRYLLDLADLPVISSESNFDEFIQRRLKSEILKAEAISVVSYGLKDYVKANYNRQAEVIPNGVDLEKMRAIDPKETHYLRRRLGLESKWVIGYIGYIGSWVNVELVVLAFRQLKSQLKDAALLWIGMSPQLDSLKKRFAGGDIIFTGGIPGDIEPYFGVVDVGIIPHRVSFFQDLAFHIKFVEYTAARKWVVATPMQQMQQLNFPNVVFAKENISDWVVALKEVKGKSWQPSWDVIVEEYDWKNIAQKFNLLF